MLVVEETKRRADDGRVVWCSVVARSRGMDEVE